jgi:hypothetical protein
VPVEITPIAAPSALRIGEPDMPPLLAEKHDALPKPASGSSARQDLC